MADNVIRIGAEFDVSQIIASVQQASNSLNQLTASLHQVEADAKASGNSILQEAAQFRLQGLSAADTASALENLGYSEKEVALTMGQLQAATVPATVAVAEQAIAAEQEAIAENSAAAATQSHSEANIQARLTTDALTGNISRAENALIRFASHGEMLGPLMQAAFAPLAVAIFAEIVVHAAEAVYKVYENVVLLKGAIESLDKANEMEAASAARLNETYLEGYAHRLEAEGKFAEARAAFRKAEEDKPLSLPKIDDKMFKQFNSEFVTFLQAVHSTADAPSVITRINAEADATAKQLEEAKARLKEFSEMDGEALAYGGVANMQRAGAEVEDLTKKYGFLKMAIGQIQSEVGSSSLALQSSLESVATKETSAAKKKEELQDKQVQKARETQDAVKAMQREWVEMMVKDFDSEMKIRAQTSATFARADFKDIQDSIKAAEEKIKAQASYTDTVNRLAEEAELRQISTTENAVSETARLEEQRLSSLQSSEFGRIRISAEVNARELEDLKKLEDEKLAVQLRYLEESKRILLGGEIEQTFVVNSEPQQLAKLEELNRQIEAAQEAHTAKMEDISRRSVANHQKTTKELTAAYMSAFAPIDRAMDGTVTGIIQGTLTVQEAFRRMGANIVISTVQSLAQSLAHHVEHDISVTLAHFSSTQAQVGATRVGAAEEEEISTIAHAKEMLLHAKGAAAGAYHWVMATVPFPVDIALAPAAAGAAFAATMAFAERGAVVPEDMPIFAHKQEMILPERISSPLQGVIPAMQKFNTAMDSPVSAASPAAAGGGSSSTSDTTNVHMSISALDSKSVSDFLHSNRAQFTKLFRTAVRNGIRLK